MNGIDDVDVAHASGADWSRLDELLLAQGVTTWVPTLVTAPLDAFAAPLARIAEAAARPGPRPSIAGAHLEGPFLGEMHGAHPSDLVRPLDLDWLAALPDTVAIVTLGPEQERAVDAIRLLRERDVLVALGHSAATFDEAVAAVDAGARLVTHCFNGMPPLHHRSPGLIGAALSDDRLAVSLIADLVHVHPTVRSRSRSGPRARRGVALITDAVAWRAATVGEIAVRFDGRAPRLARRHAGGQRAHHGRGRAQRRPPRRRGAAPMPYAPRPRHRPTCSASPTAAASSRARAPTSWRSTRPSGSRRCGSEGEQVR